MDKIDIISAHVYHVKPEDSIAQIEAIHNRWQKPIWVTEISPTTQVGNCQFSADEMSKCEFTAGTQSYLPKENPGDT